ncbi:tetratricopeptide repeat protein [Aeoliella sp. SH292]|uniref:tetratricopeptide repeat protein n=1 Tax=Aeoliella sp. SH292 TaxID=3454464 RepID=UPI003F9A5F84
MVSARITWIAATIVVFAHSHADAQQLPARVAHPPAYQAPARQAPVRHTLPTRLPVIEQTNFWREAQPLRSAAPRRLPNLPPDPAPLELPKWLLPEEPASAIALPLEPAGEAVMIDDNCEPIALAHEPLALVHEPVAKSSAVRDAISLAIANIEATPSRAASLLVVARELAVEARTQSDFTDVIEQCHLALDAGADEDTAAEIAKLGAWAYNRRGEIRSTAGNEHAAFEDFQEAVLLDDTCWQALHNRGVTLARYDKQTEALADFDRVVELAPSFAIGRYNRGEVLSQLARWQQAVADYTEALESLPNEPTLYAARGAALHEMGKLTEALADYNMAIHINPASSDAFVGRGNVYADQGLYELATADFQQALALNPQSPAAYRSTAWMLATCPVERYRNGPKAIEAATRLAQLREGESPDVLETLAAAYAADGQFAKAIAYQEQAITLTSDATVQRAYRERLTRYQQNQPYWAK